MPTPAKFDVLKGWVAGLTGVLVVIPALINAGVDIYSSLRKLPKTESERLNVELFQKYFNKQPVAAFPVPVKQNNGTVEVRFSVYEEGDVFVEFGNFTQWFPFPSAERKHAHFSPISMAFADAQGPQGSGRYQQSDRFEDGFVIRERKYDNGINERQVLNPRTGEILEKFSRRAETSSSGSAAGVSGVAPIDLDAIRSNRSSQQPGTASKCVTQIGDCQMVTPLPAGAQCACYGPAGLVPGLAR